MSYYCYFITAFPKHKIQTYIGITNDLGNRIRKHNGIIKGGAKCTRRYSNWSYCMILCNFKDKADAQSFESIWKNKNKKGRGIGYKLCNLFDLLYDPKWKNITIKFDY